MAAAGIDVKMDTATWAALIVVTAVHAGAVVVGVVLITSLNQQVRALAQAFALVAHAHEAATGEHVPVPVPGLPWFDLEALPRSEEPLSYIPTAPGPWRVRRDE